MNIFGTTFNYEARLKKIRKMMAERDVDCILIHNWTNQYYISGMYQHLPWYPLSHSFITESPLMIFREHDPVFLCALITVNAIKEGTWIKDVRAHDQGFANGVHDAIAKVLKEKGLEAGKIGVEEDCCTVSTYQNLQKFLPKAELKHAGDIFFCVRAVKDPDEIQLIKESVAIGESCLKVAMEVAQPGVSEMEVQRAIEMEMKRLGALREIETMCQSGIRTANYRAFAAEWKKIEKDELVTVDLGCLYKGYGCDMTRTWVVGTPSDEYKRIAQDMYAVYEKFVAFVKPGLRFSEVFNFVRDELEKRGYPATKLSFPNQQFAIHGLGLGPFHDPPGKTHGSMVFEPGMVLSFQPSARYETFSIRFEDDFVVVPDGLELLTTFPRTLI
ncbi:MAG: Xaa-Pro peptidase family protein [Deltaproteobacteria bacterium]|nr:Xaa-Pro peptidase family protein [Deltaproteobacteria bacterium]